MKFVSVDPGESTGYAVWPDEEPGTSPENTGTVALDEFVYALGAALGAGTPPADPGIVAQLEGVKLVVFEDWSLYPWELKNLAWDKCRTARGIGAIQYICDTAHIPYVSQAAKIKEAAVAGGAEELFLRPLHPNRHANDAIMHGVHHQSMKALTVT